MRLREAVASALHLIVILSFLSLSCFALVLSSHMEWRLIGMHWLEFQPHIFYWIAAGFGLVGILFMFGFFGVGRGRFLRLYMKPHAVTIDAKLIEKAIEECFKAHFPEHLRGANVVVSGKKRLEVALNMAPCEDEVQEKLFHDVEQKLGTLLHERFGYNRPFTLSVHSK